MSERVLIFDLKPSKMIDIFNKLVNINSSYLTNKNISSNIIDNQYKESFNIVELNKLSVCDFIINQNIKILIVNRFENCFKKIEDICTIFTIIPTKRPTIFYIENLVSHMTTLKNGEKEKLVKMEIIQEGNNKPESHIQSPSNSVSHESVPVEVEDESLKGNHKKAYRSICNIYSKFVSHLPLKPIKQGLNNEAVLVEYRDLPHLETLVRNTIYHLGDTWSYTIICGNVNYPSINNFCSFISPKIKIIKTDHNNITQNEYNNFLLTDKFWDLLSGEKILIYQEDSLIFNSNINIYLSYDYVGGPFKWDCVKPINVGNGGLSLRSKSIMKEIIKRGPPCDFKSESGFVNRYKKRNNLDMYPEDIYFPQSMQTLNIGRICPYQLALSFASEQIFTPNAFGMHCLWFCNKKWDVIVKQYFKELTKNITGKLSVNTLTNTSWKYHFDVLILHCKDFNDRKNNITDIHNTLNYKISDITVNIKSFDGINTTSQSLEINNQKKLLAGADKNLKFKDENDFIFYKSGQIGAYISHHLMIKTIINKGSLGYSIILEDDVIISDTILTNISKTLDYFSKTNREFDIIFLGTHNDNNGTLIRENIYEINKEFMLFGAYGLLINNKSARKLYNYNQNITGEIDNHYKNLIDNNLIKGFYIKPILVSHDKKCKSYITLP
jgi:GR25 family glycosyltransferase involved in LPS biosynthesis